MMKFALIIYNFIYFTFFVPVGFIGYIVSKDKRYYSNRLGFNIPKKKIDKSFWFHGASIGEIRSLSGIIKNIKKKYPDYSIIISTMTTTGLETAKNEYQPDVAFLLPLENIISLRNIFKHYGVRVLLITDTELWPNLIASVPRDVGLILINGRISDKSVNTYRKYSFVFKHILNRFNVIFAKSPLDEARFKMIAPDANVILGANIKNYINRKPILKEVQEIKGRLALAASTHGDEESFFISSVGDIALYDKFIIVPRHPYRAKDIVNMIRNMGFDVCLLSESVEHKVIVVDKIGLLDSLYQVCSRIFVGGSVSNIGGHNIFEAIQYYKSVCTGIYMQNFSEIVPLAQKYSLLTLVNNKEELKRYFLDENHNCNFDLFYEELQSSTELFLNSLFANIDKFCPNDSL